MDPLPPVGGSHDRPLCREVALPVNSIPLARRHPGLDPAVHGADRPGSGRESPALARACGCVARR